MKSYFSLYVVVLISAALSAISKAEVSDHSNPLMSLFRHFNENRHHVTNPQGKQRARDFIMKTFQDLGLKTWSEKFQPDHPQVWTCQSLQFGCGHNVVGMVPGTLAGSPDDRLFLIGAHYDTVRHTQGADDNGSGVVALLQVAKQIVADFKTSPRRRPFSILFVAFDFEEWEDCSNVKHQCACDRIGCGSRAYVANLTRFYNGSLSSNGNLQGAIIMDTVMNYNSTPYSQILPNATSQLLPEIYNQIKKDEFRGNFLAVIGRKVDERFLLDLFYYHYNQVKSDLKNKTTMYPVELPFRGQPSKLDSHNYKDFLRSDHEPFWESNHTLRAIFLSDTADFRERMTSCYHEDCDRLSRVTPQMLQFLKKTIDVILSVTNDVTEQSCPQRIPKFLQSTDVSEDGMEEWEVALLAIGMILVGVLKGVVAVVCHQRWKKQQGPLVTTRDLAMQSSTNPDNTV
ncbi:uncharacterized protein [Montipora capricornis]|uniref:uncharacterized protein isoform X2 n=1 Tax=Montipora capricornis TaxID=246305 RepID=UPI0035F1184D